MEYIIPTRTDVSLLLFLLTNVATRSIGLAIILPTFDTNPQESYSAKRTLTLRCPPGTMAKYTVYDIHSQYMM